MKKLLILVIGFLVALSPGMASAQATTTATTTLTKAQVEDLAPSLRSLFASISSTAPAFIRTNTDSQNAALRNHSQTLVEMSRKLSSTTTVPTTSELETMRQTIANIQAEVSAISTWRTNTRLIISNMFEAVTRIGHLITSAV